MSDAPPSKLVQRGLAQLVKDYHGPSTPPAAVTKSQERSNDFETIAHDPKDEDERGHRIVIAVADSLSSRLCEAPPETHNDLKRVFRATSTARYQANLLRRSS